MDDETEIEVFSKISNEFEGFLHCVNCDPGFILGTKTKCILCREKYQNCVSCDQDQCKICGDGFFISDGSCPPCNNKCKKC